MPRTAKLFINLIISAAFFNYFIQVLILLLNPGSHLDAWQFAVLFGNLFLFYGPIWIVFTGVIFFVVQFFAEKKYPIGFFTPPTLTYFLSFTILVVSFVLYLNYDYYYQFLEGPVKTNFIRVLSINLALVLTGVIFVFFKKISKKWAQIFFMAVLLFNVLYGFQATVLSPSKSRTDANKTIQQQPVKNPGTGKPEPRKIRVVVMDGLSLDVINSLASEQKLLNFSEIINKGVSGRFETIRPNMSLSLLNTAFSGVKPSHFPLHSFEKFKFAELDYEFDVRPRFVFFRKSTHFNLTTFYNRNNSNVIDNLRLHYESKGLKTANLLRTIPNATYSELSLTRNNRFVLLFPDLLKKSDEKDKKYELLKRYFFFDDYLKGLIPVLKDSTIFYSIVQLPGLGIISRYFYQYYMPELFGSITREDPGIKQYGSLLAKYYEYYDSIIGNLMSTTGDNELLVIVSFFEYEPLPLWRRILLHLFGEQDIFVYIPLNSQGTILMYEKNALKTAYPIKDVSILDIYPTLLYYAGFQLSTHLHGEVLKEIFTDEFLLNNPIDIDTDAPGGQ